MIEERQRIMDRLADEYKILQDKIDKIGAFRFTVKGWSLTLIVATLLAGSATKVSPPWVVSVLMYVFIGVFFFIEKNQTDLSGLFGQRARHIESVMTNMLRTAGNGTRLDEVFRLRRVPGIAYFLRDRALETRFERYSWVRNGRFFRTRYWRKAKEYWRADLWFYFVQAIVVLCVTHYIQVSEIAKDSSSSPVQIIENKTSFVADYPHSIKPLVRNKNVQDAKKKEITNRDRSPEP